MLNKDINDFLQNKKEIFLKNKITASTNDEDKLSLTQKANDKYSLKSWLIDSSSRASQLSITSHPAKFIHPNAKATSIIAKCEQKNDGLLRTSNVKVSLDIFGNAAALDVEKFLRIEIEDKTILEHLELNTKLIKSIFNIQGIKFDEIRDNFLKIKTSNTEQTSEKLKQVYFPVDDDYHLLSILIPSGIVFKLKEKINNVNFSDRNKKIREAIKKETPIKGIINTIINLTNIGYGGTQPQNISTLNSQNGGISFLLSSMPPNLEKRKTQAPKVDFFKNCLWISLFKSDFKDFHNILNNDKNNKAYRNKRDDIVINSTFKIKRLVENIRYIQIGWSQQDNYSNLSKWQKIWLDDKYKNIRNDKTKNENYLEKAYTSFANWFINNYQCSVNKNKILGVDDINHISKILQDEKELLK
jgi:CRISPR-associated protein Csy1